MLVLPRLIPAYISFQIASFVSAFPNFGYFILQRTTWFRVILMVIQMTSKVASLHLAAMHKANIEAISFFEVTFTQKRSKRPITPRVSKS